MRSCPGHNGALTPQTPAHQGEHNEETLEGLGYTDASHVYCRPWSPPKPCYTYMSSPDNRSSRSNRMQSWSAQWTALSPGSIQMPRNGLANNGPRSEWIVREGHCGLNCRALARLEQYDDIPSIGFWTDPSEFLSWNLGSIRPGTYAVQIWYACDREASGSIYQIGVDDGLAVTAKVLPTRSWADFALSVPIGQIEASSDGEELLLRAEKMARGAVMNLRSVRLTPLRADP